MSITTIVHITNEEPILCEVEQLPNAADQVVIINNPRRRDGKELMFLEDDVALIIIPWHRINFIQVLPSAETEEVITFVRE
jgi:hypothetical protein